MAEDIAYENGRISNFEGLVTLSLTLDRTDRVILHTVFTVVHHSLTSTYVPNVIEIKEIFVDGRTF